MFTHLYRQSISCVLSTVLLSNMLYGTDLAVDATAAAQHRANLDATANGVPLVNIVTPNGSGLSHNKFSDFNVNTIGLILNNATGITSTQLGGMVQGNANLGTTPARVILNEVTGISRTLLRGYTEVAGHSADVIVANPNGITVNGGGFINTPRATLSTGTPSYSGGVYQGLKVTGGDILIEGTGFNASNIDRVDFYTKTLQLNAQIHAKRLDVITGENDISADGSTYTATNGTATQTYSIDSSALGGIYANAITLIATDHGVGVNLPEITYASDSLTLNADGHIVLGLAVSDNTLSSTSQSLSVNGLLRSGTTMDLQATDTLTIASNGVILSGGDITIHDTGTVRNEAGRIEADNDLSIQASAIENLSSMIPIKTTQHIARYATRMVTRSTDSDDWNWDDLYTEKWLDSIDKTAYTPAYILAGNDMSLDGAIHNRYSIIAADRDLYLAGSLNNEAALNAHDIIQTQYYYTRENQDCGWSGCHWNNNSYWGALNRTDTLTDHVYSTISAGRNLLGNLATVNNADITTGSNYSSLGIAPTSYVRNLTTGAITYDLPHGGNGEYTLAADPALPYLIESNPLFTNYNTFISSDYMMSRLHLNMAADTKRLGDARYETQLVRDAVFRLTGERRLAGFGTDTTQYQALMDNAISVAGDLHLALGISLSSSQIASLDRDIVWMEERTVAGQKVLVPVVYLASLKNQELTAGGKIIADSDMVLAVAGELNNAGAIRAGGSLVASADSMTNRAGSIKSTGDMLLHATNDITNTSGTISGNNVALLSDNGSITSQTDHKQLDLSNHAGTTGHLDTVGESAGIWAQGNLTALAAKEINLVGSATASGGDMSLIATTGALNIKSLEQNSHAKMTTNNGSSEIEHIKQHAASVNAGGNATLNAAKDITINSSTIAAGNNVTLTAGENVNITASNNRDLLDVKTHNKSTFSSKSTRDMSLKESVASSSITGENIAITSGKDTTVQGSDLNAHQNIAVNAIGDINVIAKGYQEGEVHEESNGGLGGSKSSMNTTAANNLTGSSLQAGNDVTLQSNNDINVIASDMSATNALNVTSSGDTNILAGQESTQHDEWSKKTGWFNGANMYGGEVNSKGTVQTTAKGSALDGNTIAITTGGDTNVQGSAIAGENDVTLTSAKNITIDPASEQYTSQQRHDKTSWGIFGSGGIGITIGQQQASDALKNNETTQSQSRSMVGSINGNLNVKANDTIAITGSDIVAGKDMNLQAKTVTIQAGSDDAASTETHAFRQSGVTLAITGAVVDAIQMADNMQKTSKKTSNDRVKGLAAAATALSAASAVGEVAPILDASTEGGTNAIGISLTIGSSQSKSENTSSANTHSGSSVAAGGDITITASGDTSKSDITISGSDVTGKNITLSADDAILLSASEDSYSNHSSNSSSSGGIGVGATVGAGGMAAGITANASIGRGKSDGVSTVHNNSHITAHDTLTLNSVGNTTLKGATAKADTIKADVGGNLNIESLQNTDKYKSSSFNVGGSITVGAGVSGNINAGFNKAKSDYASVNEQSGLSAGDGGFQITVGKNTDLKGGIIFSNQTAIDNDKNTLTTATLTTSDINNHASASANGGGISVGSDAASGLYGAAKAVIGSALMFADESGSSAGTTKAAISTGIVTITDTAKQKELTGKTVQETIASINTDTKNAHTAATKQDVQKMQENVQLQQEVNQAVFKEAVKFTDEAYLTMFLKQAKIVEILKDENGKVLYDENKNIMTRELSNEEKNNLQKGSDGKVHITDNGIFNDPDAAAKYAAQHSNTNGALYAINFPEAQNGLSELMIAGYQKFMEGDALGLTNATQETKMVMRNYGTEGLHLDGHSRGSLTVANAMDSMTNDSNAKGSLSQTTINFFGPAQNVANADETLGYLQDRDSITDINEKNNMVIKYEAHMADPVARLIGWNDPTGGIVPQTEPIVIKTVSGFPLSNENTTFGEMLRAATGQENTSHNLYFINPVFFQPGSNPETRLQLIDNFWGGTTPLLMPIRTYTAPKASK